jgi:hypothetical protein
MKLLSSVLLAAFALAAPALLAQAAPPPACPPTANLDQLITAIDDAVSGPADKDRTCFRDVMLPDARLIPVSKQPDGTIAPRILTIDGWIDAVRKRGSGVFYERQIKVKSETYGPIAHLWSTYEVRPTPDGKAEVRGINSIQAVFDGQRWRVIEITWHAETPADPVPAQYMP